MSEDALPVGETVVGAWRILASRSHEAARLALVPFLLFFALRRLDSYVDSGEGAMLEWSFIYTVLYAAPAAVLLVPWYRAILGGEAAPLRIPVETWRRFLVRWLALEGMFFLALLPLHIAAIRMQNGAPAATGAIPLTAIAVIPLALYLYSRCSLALTAAAIGAPDGFRQSWHLTEANGWRIVGAAMLAIAPLFAAGMILDALLPEHPSPQVDFASSALLAGLAAATELVGATVMAVIFRRLTRAG